MNKKIRALSLLLLSIVLIWFSILYFHIESEPKSQPTTPERERTHAREKISKTPSRIGTNITTEQNPKPDSAPPLEQLTEFLPKWLQDAGSTFQDTREINGHTVHRSRGRHTWENGEQLEIEITDVGNKADEELIKSLGFDLALTDSESESGFTTTQNLNGYIINQEYDENDQSGTLQMLIDDRFLIEIQIQQFPESVFQEIIDTDIPFEEIFKQLE
ncbi:hypothetical protein [Rubritalea sp.]|uniref:hypothetical protein n=1 Tax=Rubritalea sp. TaxID=2109375 RepID=UPI003EF74EEA